MKTILVTGGSGFIGSHTCISLLENNFRVIVIDSLANSSSLNFNILSDILNINFLELSERFFIYKGDIRDEDFLIKIFQEFRQSKKNIDSVIHFAGLKAVNESILRPLEYWSTNVGGTISLLKIMSQFNCYELVFSSSATVYDYYFKGLLDEKAPLNPQNPYGRNKLTIEHILKDLHISQPDLWKIAILRYFNPIGAHFSGKIGEAPLKDAANLFPLICQVAAKKRDRLQIYGNDWPTNDGTGIRDFIHVMDLAEAHLSSLKYIDNSSPNIFTFNIGTGKGTTVLELIKIFEKVNNCVIPIEFTKRRKGDVSSSVANIQLALKVLDWFPNRTIEEACLHGWKWQLNNQQITN